MIIHVTRMLASINRFNGVKSIYPQLTWDKYIELEEKVLGKYPDYGQISDEDKKHFAKEIEIMMT